MRSGSALLHSRNRPAPPSPFINVGEEICQQDADLTIRQSYGSQRSMIQHGEDDKLIASDDLDLNNVPSPEADRQTLETFCLTIDGYEGERYSFEQLFRQADLIEQRGLDRASLDELRSAAFILQRNLHGTSHGDDAADAPTIARIRRLVAEVRRRCR